ncbi:acetoacetate--CoA ligase [Conexibacter sp. JD483]|uniref:acetoacetate--CoA ligase n=1 Tax=unclassified Conexibacter TaxID=2627773 RepID=UPI002724E666|nr:MULTISPECIES: acetoacetate--CoA ligase [unclassified Conexibacter]MDO8186886.1 acetoacetate--CoA ligase [Conexibacter sp. CPCC 205706]MDO8200802.1 acetoacetate--CoA ligase [Conexibacter sp. CPCC 205762]MDR9369938.1 acetoacetate--CoA ligase [Conexibacter sp. JD483]
MAAARDTPPILWTPTPERVREARLTQFARWLREERGVAAAGGSYAELWQWSVDEPEAFWAAIWDHFEVIAHAPCERVLGRREMPGAQWFPGATLNYAEHIFRGRDDAAVAIRHATELRPLAALTWGGLRALTARIATALRAEGIVAGDRVVAYVSNLPEAVATLLACASIGAIWSSASPDFGASGVADRFAQIEPALLLAVDGYQYGGKRFDRLPVLAELQRRLPTLRRTVVLRQLDPQADLSGLRDAVAFDAWSGAVPLGEPDPAAPPLTFAAVPFEHPLWVLYSSGTTGLPKAIVQGQGGILLEQLKHQHLHVDAQAEDRVFWFTTTGWMMWNFLVGCLLTPASIVLYDGNPGWPSMDRLWQFAEDAGVTIFGTSASYLSACMKAGIAPGAAHDLSRLHAVGSTGSPLAPEGFEWVYRHLGEETWLFSTSGGTDVCSAFVGGVPTLPVHRGELQARALGAKVEAFDPDGSAVIGEVGELVLTEPLPSMPLFLWNDPDGSRYRDAYFDMFPGVWRHGDWIEITARGTAIISGRSDSTINRGGVRMGTAEIYRSVLAHDDVVDALVVDLPKPGTEGWIELFVVLRPGAALDDRLRATIRAQIRGDCSPRHVPDVIEQIAEVPRTLSGKALEVPVKRILSGIEPERAASRDALANPGALDFFVARVRSDQH